MIYLASKLTVGFSYLLLREGRVESDEISVSISSMTVRLDEVVGW